MLLAVYTGCDVDYFDNPNAPQEPPTAALLNDNLKEMIDDLYDEWFSGRFTQVTMQYWTQTEYGDEDRYVFRESTRQTWQDFYTNLENLRKVLYFNTDEDTKAAAAASGPNVNQIATTRIVMAWIFNIMADTWGPVPYYSYGNDDPDFQALKIADVDEEILTPVYASQEKIYTDILNELSEAVAQMDESQDGFIRGDNLYSGDMTQWRKFANSLRLRVALKIMGVNSSLAQQHIDAALASGVFESNDDNASFGFEDNATNAAPMYVAYNVDNRKDFGLGFSFSQLLKGENIQDTLGNDITTNPFNGIVDPRLPVFAQPNDSGNYMGMPVVENSSEAATIKFESLPGDAVINIPNYSQELMEYAEVLFIQSELEGWDQTLYEQAVRASMEKWGVATADIDAYIAALPAASEETVLTQKFIALYMDPHTAWAEYRRTGYPQTLVMPNDHFSVTVESTGDTRNFFFVPLIPVDDLPSRMRYPQYERTLNEENRAAAVSTLSNGDAIDSKLWWDVD